MGTTATFTGTSGAGTDFAVLNRIIPADPNRPIQFNGTVNSEINISGSLFPGGKVFFFSPGGIILGSTATFDVGSLALTTLDLAYDTGTGAFDTAGSYVFQQATVADSKVRVLNGAQISTTDSGTYVALVAPSVTNDGTMIVDGSVALVAADAATLTFSPNGLFDILVTSGSSSAATVVANGGTITGPVSPNINSSHRVYMVAVAKNDAISMALGSGSTLGFDIAGAADFVGNAVVLSAGYDVVGGTPDVLPSAGGGTGLVSVSGTDADVTSSFFARANGGVNLGSNSAAGLNFAWDANIIAAGANSSLYANAGGNVTVVDSVSIVGDDISGSALALGKDVEILAAAGGTITINGNLSLSSAGRGADSFIALTTAGAGSGGLARVRASNGGQITILGDATLDALGLGGDVATTEGTGGLGTGGSAKILASGTAGSFVNISGDVTLGADGAGGFGLLCASCLSAGGFGFGGSAEISASGTNTVTIGGSTTVNASGLGGDAQDGLAGNATGGFIDIAANNGGDLTVHGMTLTATGTGGDGFAVAQAGNGLGGDIDVSAFGGLGSVAQFNGTFDANATGFGGASLALGGTGGTGAGGVVVISARNGTTLDFNDALTAAASGLGASGNLGSISATGGLVSLDAQTSGTITVAFATDLNADGRGGFSSTPSLQSVSTGGTAEITLTGGGSIQLAGTAEISAEGQGYRVTGSGQAGDAQGGTARISGLNAGLFSVTGGVNLTAAGYGGLNNASPFALVQGGNGTGGTASFTYTGGNATLGAGLALDASGVGGLGGQQDATTIGGIGTGGLVQLGAGTPLLLGGGSMITVTSATTMFAKGTGGDGYTAGAGIGGDAVITARQGNLQLGNIPAGMPGSSINVSVDGDGGDALGAGSAGIGQGGSIGLSTYDVGFGGATFSGTVALAADGRGGQALSGGEGANGFGGSILTSARDGTTIGITTDFSQVASGLGGNGQTGSSFGIGGIATLDAQTGGNVIISGTTNFYTIGVGGNIAQPGSPSLSIGGLAEISLLNGGTVVTGAQTNLYAYSIGRKVSLNGLGGSAQGGTARIVGSIGSLFNANGSVILNAQADGGSSLASPNSSIQGGDGTGGTAAFEFTGGLATVDTTLDIIAFAYGGLGDLNNAAGLGGNGIGGFATLSAGGPLASGNGAVITVGSDTFLQVDGYGRDSYNGGAGIAGEAVISARNGSLSLADVVVLANGFGGDGSSGGAGDSGTGGVVNIVAHSDLAGPSLISMGQLTAEAIGDGGNGGNAPSAGLIGGNAGSAHGGTLLIAGSAGNGALEIGDVTAWANADGDDGGSGNEASGGNGGNAFAGSVRIGLISGADTGSLNLGYATYNSITASADATGGLGGTGDSGIAGAVGGNGGTATAGTATLLVEGSMVTINGLGEWRTDAIGGDGGFGDGFGTGGNAVIGSAIPALPAGTAAIVKSRVNQPTQLGILDAADLTFSATALGGVGSTAGTSTKAGQAAAFLSDGGSISADSISLLSQANLDAAPNVIDPIKMTNSTATIIAAFALTTSSATSVTLDQSLLSAGSLTIDATNWVLDPVVPASLGTLEANSFMSLSSGLNLVAHANLSTQSSLFLNALGAIDLGAIAASGTIIASAGTALSLDSVSSGTFINLSATNAITTGDLFAATSISAGSQGNIFTGNITAGGGQPQVPSGPSTLIELFADGSVSTGTIFTSSDLNVIAGNAITTDLATADDMVFLSGSSVSTGALAASGRVLIGNASMEGLGFDGEGFDPNLFFAATLTTPVTPTPGAIAISGPVNATAFTAATHAAFSSGAITVTPSTTGSGNLLINAGSTLTAANLLAANTLQLNANGAISSGTLRSNTQGVKVVSLGSSIATGGINARNDVLLSAAQSISVIGTINARDVLVLSGSNVGLGAVFAGAVSTPANPTISNATGRVLIASNAMASESFLLSNSTNYAALLDAEPILLSGSVNIADRVVAGRFVSVSQGNMSAMTIAAFGSLEVESGGLVTVAQRWGSPDLEIASSDIRIVDNGNLLTANGQQVLSGLRTIPTGSVSLSSIGSGPALIGDGLTGSGYALSATELGLISAGSIFIGAVDNSTNPIDMLIGNLALTAGGDIGASNLAGTTGRIAFVTGNRSTQIPGGVIRVTGNITGTGFSATNVVEFATGRFELDASTGSLSLTQTGTALGGIIELSAANIHIASGTILDRLAADPFYEGHISDLNRPAAVRRPEGVLRALGLDLYPTGTLYIQNTGTSFDPAGFFADFEFTDLNPPANATPASVSVIVNGRWQTSDGIVGGVAARDLVVENGENLELYTADSSINGCAIDASACAVEPEADPVPAISSQIAIVSDNVLGNTPQFTEGTSDPGEDEAAEEKRAIEEALAQAEGASSPIAPPPQIIDSKPLESQPMIEQPVAGSGNPSLIGSVVNENSAEGEAQ